jgi:outer membrane lipoprotein-sorting protein
MRTFALSALLIFAGAPAYLYADTTPTADLKNDPRAIALLKSVDDLWRGESSYARMTMKVKTERYERSITIQAWSKGAEKSLIRIEKPKKEKGIATLKSDRNIYTYLPKTDRTIKLSSGMMGGSWMGSHFTNDDLVAEARLSEDFNITISYEGKRGGQEIIELTLIPKEDAAIVWGKLVSVVDKKSLNPIRQEYYDEDMELARTMTYHDIKKLGGRMVPVRMRLIPQDEPDEYTEMIYEVLELDVDLKDSFFSLSRLKRR